MSGWGSRPLDARGRRWAFALAAAAIALSGVLLMRFGGEPARDDDAGPAPTVLSVARTTPVAVAPTPRTTTTPAAPAPPLGVSEQRAAVAAARRFLGAYLHWEVGDARGGVRVALRANATRAFGDELLSSPPRVSGAPARPGRIDGLELGDTLRAETPAVAATVDRGGTVTPLIMRLAREEGRWRISGLG
ncbi:hypothetical protein [Conexibacter woesei]|uniref:Uncharacterized protein n=1 Tax=Conexibacter woesei (strain DSM 14684 / CCUG 47730 / CIP 108061 / JCM 11494 / NBRC 100937 / ID131577) TaxID=469383 RepID=D3EZ01_CONWI|nr:hypothetical protein [Conexibacter woesei]ADB49875.1 hypothetical protein Cwoe_1447 [Conexibacter woesei DSM 14684]